MLSVLFLKEEGLHWLRLPLWLVICAVLLAQIPDIFIEVTHNSEYIALWGI